MKIKKDLKEYVENRLPGIVEEHLNTWKDRYYRQSLSDVVSDISYNYDMSCEFENLDEELKREISTNEYKYFENQFIKCLKENFYK